MSINLEAMDLDFFFCFSASIAHKFFFALETAEQADSLGLLNC